MATVQQAHPSYRTVLPRDFGLESCCLHCAVSAWIRMSTATADSKFRCKQDVLYATHVAGNYLGGARTGHRRRWLSWGMHRIVDALRDIALFPESDTACSVSTPRLAAKIHTISTGLRVTPTVWGSCGLRSSLRYERMVTGHRMRCAHHQIARVRTARIFTISTRTT